jgi:hypothetical protein
MGNSVKETSFLAFKPNEAKECGDHPRQKIRQLGWRVAINDN